jgi:AraC-like DNA-binding protein
MTIEILFTLHALFALSRLKPTSVLVQQSDTGTTDAAATSAEKYANSSLDDAARRRIIAKLQDVMERQHMYKQASLSLGQLSGELRESPHYLSQVINQDLGTSFYDWVNRYRIETAKEALLNKPDKTILAVAEDVGFNSKSTFNTAFRHYTQMTPSEYRRQKPTTAAD